MPNPSFPIDTQVYTPEEIAAAAGLETDVVRAEVGPVAYVGHAAALDTALRLRRRARLEAILNPVEPPPVFGLIGAPAAEPRQVPFAVSGTVHALFVSAAILLGSFQVAPAAHVTAGPPQADDARLVFLNLPGPGGGGGGGGHRETAAPPKALRKGQERISSPIPDVQPPVPPHAAPEPPPLNGETFPVITAPVIASPADRIDHPGLPTAEPDAVDSRGSGTLDGTGTGAGRGLGQGTGSGIGEGSGGGTGGGPYRPGSGITPPRVLREVKATYTEQARRAGLTGDVVLEVVVRRTGTVGNVRVVSGLGAGLDERAVDAVRQWTFAPATRQGTPVDVIVEVSVEFSLR